MKRTNLFIYIASCILLLGMSGCDRSTLIDTNEEMPQRNWSYVQKVKATVDIKNQANAFTLKFKLRHTADYRYANIFILMHLSGPGMHRTTRRYEYRLAKSDGEWLGQGSGNLYTYTLPLLSDYHFPQPGTYTIEIEQNMRDNPLKEVSDAGVLVSQIGNN